MCTWFFGALLQLGGYVAWFDLRDPGAYTLEVSVGWYFGGRDPRTFPPLRLMNRVQQSMNYCNYRRSLINNGGQSVTAVALLPQDVTPEQQRQRFGTGRCSTPGHSAHGRWIQLGADRQCKPPYCTGDFHAVFPLDPVRCSTLLSAAEWWQLVFRSLLSNVSVCLCECVRAQDGDATRRWMWVPHSCYLHLPSPVEALLAFSHSGIRKLLVTGDSQQREAYIGLAHVLGARLHQPKFSRHNVTLFVADSAVTTTFQSYELDTILRGYQETRSFRADEHYLRYHGITPMQQLVSERYRGNVGPGGRVLTWIAAMISAHTAVAPLRVWPV